MRYKILLLFFVIIAISVNLFSQDISNRNQNKIPDAKLKIAVRQKEDGNLGKAIHILQLDCWQGECTLTSVTLNQCWNFFGDVFYPVIQISSTREGTLKVKNLGDRLEISEVVTDLGGESNCTYLFGFALDRSLNFTNKVTSFSGGFIKHSELANRVITIEYVPFIGIGVIVELDCNTVGVPAVDTTK